MKIAMMIVSFVSMIIIYIRPLRESAVNVTLPISSWKFFYNTVVQFALDQICSLVIEIFISYPRRSSIEFVLFTVNLLLILQSKIKDVHRRQKLMTDFFQTF